MRCVWCQNPESHQRKPEAAFYVERCQGCFHCETACPVDAIARDPHRESYFPAAMAVASVRWPATARFLTRHGQQTIHCLPYHNLGDSLVKQAIARDQHKRGIKTWQTKDSTQAS